MFVSVLVRRLRPGKTYEDFVAAWYPDEGFGIDGRGPYLARSFSDEREIFAVGFLDLPSREAVEGTSVRGIYEIVEEFDFSSDATVAAGRPPYLERESES